jgi:hypothetical protein
MEAMMSTAVAPIVFGLDKFVGARQPGRAA